MKKIGREPNEPGLCEFYGQIRRMLIDPVALMKDDHRGPFALDFGERAHRVYAATEFDRERCNINYFVNRHGRLRTELTTRSELSRFSRRFAPKQSLSFRPRQSQDDAAGGKGSL